VKFTWDPEKESENRRKHKIAFAEACTIFADKYALTIFDEEHSSDEERWITIGQMINANILVVVHTYRDMNNEEYIRIISARKATRTESKTYWARRG
jgi:uncharacterized DUF497 family protein